MQVQLFCDVVSVSMSETLFRDIYAERGGVLTNTQICAGGEAGKDSCQVSGEAGGGEIVII